MEKIVFVNSSGCLACSVTAVCKRMETDQINSLECICV